MNGHYFNFQIEIEESDEGYVVRVTDSPTGTASAIFSPPLPENDLDRLGKTLDTRAAGEVGPEQEAFVRSVGQRLFQALFAGELANLLHASMRAAYKAQAGLRLRLDLTQTPEFEHLPWEYLHDPTTNEYLGLSIHSPLTRHIARMHRIDSYTVEPPLRVLVAVAEPATYAQFDGRRKWLNLIDAIDYLARDRRLVLEQLKKPTLFELQRRLRQGEYHIFHFIGHGVFARHARDGLLIMEDEIGHARTVSGQHLGTMIRDHFPLRLAVLQSCDDFTDGIRDNPFALAANHIVTRSVPAAIALPLPMPADLTVTFLHTLYAGMANYLPVDLAVTEARLAMQRRRASALWGAPLLFSRAPDEQLFDNGDLLQWQDSFPQRREPSLWERVMRMGRT